ncbi:unnamed protein product [Ectocarpus fasciculatus]
MQALIRHGVDVNAPDSNGCTALHSAAMGDKVGAIDVLIEAGAIINVQGGDNGARYTPLHMASKKGSSKAALSLVKHGADVHRSGRMSRWGRSCSNALNLAAGGGHIAIVKTLLAAGVNVNLRPAYSDESALYSAFQEGHADIVTTLIQHGAIVDATDSRGCTALFKVGQKPNAALIDKLVAAGAAINGIVDNKGKTPLHYACMDDCPEAIVSMLRYGARVDAKDDDGDTPLHAATWCSEGIRTLVEYGADVEALTANGRTPLALAATWGCEDGAKLLLEAGADVNAPADYADGSAALSLAYLGDCNVDDIMKVLIQHGADVNARDTDGLSALHHAAIHNEVDGIDVLISAGAIIEAPDKHKSTPLAVAFRSAVHRWKNKHNCGVEEFSAVIALLKHGADPNIRNIQKGCPHSLLYYFVRDGCPISVLRELLAAGPNIDIRAEDGYTPLMVSQDHPELFSELLLHGADTNVQNNYGQTALHEAVERDNGVCIEALISAGASTDVKDRTGHTPLHLATINRNRNVMRMLLRSGADIASADNEGSSALHLAAAHDDGGSGDSAIGTTMDLLLRWGADENAVDSGHRIPLSVWKENGYMRGLSWAYEKSVLKMFERAPRDRAWRRRGWLVLCRAFPNRVRLKADNAGTCPGADRSVRARSVGAGVGSGSSSVPPVGEAGGGPVGTLAGEKHGVAAGLSALVAKVVGLHEDGVFRAIMEFV